MISPNSDFCHPSAHDDVPVADSAPAGAARDNSDKAELLALIGRANQDDSAAQAELVHRYTRRVAGFVRAIIRQPDAVEDVTQLVFIKMFRRLSRLREPAVFESWLFTLARNTSLDFLRRRSCRPNTVALEDEVYQIADPSTGGAMAEIQAALERALARLTPIDRALVSQFVAGETYGDIAERTGLSLATVKVRLHRVRPFLRTIVGELTDTRVRGGKGWRATAGNRATTTWAARTPLAA